MTNLVSKRCTLFCFKSSNSVASSYLTRPVSLFKTNKVLFSHCIRGLQSQNTKNTFYRSNLLLSLNKDNNLSQKNYRNMSSDSQKEWDLIVLGGGSGGVATARRATSYGAKVLLFENNRLGGTCVNVGCVPKKVMWHAASIASDIKHVSKYYGFTYDNLNFNFQKLKNARDDYVKRLNGIYKDNLDKEG